MKAVYRGVVILALLIMAMPVAATTFGWETVLRGSTRTACIRLYITGICVFLDCGLQGCKIRVSPRIRHHLPDLVVSSYNDPGESPFDMTRSQSRNALAALEAESQRSFLGVPPAGATEPTIPDGNPRHLRFKEAQTVGNPAITLYQLGSQVMRQIAIAFPYAPVYLCPSKSRPFHNYHQSEADAWAWRTGAADAWLLDGRIIGAAGSHNWAPIRPRMGFMIQNDDAKTGAVAAYRSVDLVTRTGQPHQYTPLPVSASRERDGNWLLVHPAARSSCTSLGADNHQLAGVHDPDGDQGWIYWPQYTCCVPQSGIRIATIPLPSIPVPLPSL